MESTNSDGVDSNEEDPFDVMKKVAWNTNNKQSIYKKVQNILKNPENASNFKKSQLCLINEVNRKGDYFKEDTTKCNENLSEL